MQYPAHAHWSGCCGDCDTTVTVDWGQFGNYTMEVGAEGKTMAGCYTGYPDGALFGFSFYSLLVAFCPALSDLADHFSFMPRATVYTRSGSGRTTDRQFLFSDGRSPFFFYIFQNTLSHADWRKATFVRAHTAQELAQIKAQTAANHGHQHGPGCNH